MEAAPHPTPPDRRLLPGAMFDALRRTRTRLCREDGIAVTEYVGLVAVVASVGATVASAIDIDFGTRLAEALMGAIEGSLPDRE